jgi:nucleoside-diphosphate-sugar epimerase
VVVDPVIVKPVKTRRSLEFILADGVIVRIVMDRLADRYDLRARTRSNVEFPSFIGDVSNLDAIVPAFEGIDAVVHLAGSSAVESSWDAVLQSNLIGTYNVFEAARLAGVPSLIFASSNHAIGEYEFEGAPSLYRLDDDRVYDHTVEVRPDSLYGVSKVYGEALVR